MLRVRRRHDDLGENLVRQQGDLAARLVLGRDEELLHRDFATAGRRHELHLGVQSDQGGTQARSTDEVSRAAVSQDGVILVLAIGNQRLAALVLRQQPEALAEIPAARPLAQIAADRPHVPDLRAGDSHRRVCSDGKFLRISAFSTNSSRVTAAPMRSPPPDF